MTNERPDLDKPVALPDGLVPAIDSQRRQTGMVRPVRGVVRRQKQTPGEGVVHRLSPKQIQFLQVYSSDLDFTAACKASGLKPHQVEKSPYLRQEIEYINQAASLRHRSDAMVALGNHLRIMDKVETLYDESFQEKTKVSCASTLARMSETTLKAAGVFNDDTSQGNVQAIQFVVNFGHPEAGQ